MVGNGNKIRFWEDVWRGDEAFCNQFLTLYRACSRPTGKISPQDEYSGNNANWNTHLQIDISDKDLVLCKGFSDTRG
ncbi:hypothetical protein TorRG33x02_245800 [Trema orientale]|uniref:Uncharacterized protein n=1 Tax=Trema orientale TaxID=63057 RepID=A0A2P5DP10_TREOI|nr:hypothetical protein TorRG33x02_245800 [Trema orientale]